jgi:hypothetical protein
MKFNKFCHTVVVTVLHKGKAQKIHSTKLGVLYPDTYNDHKKICAIDSELEGKRSEKHCPSQWCDNPTHYFNGADNIYAINGRRKLTDILLLIT